MIVREPYELPADKQRIERRAVWLEWATLFWLSTIVVVIYLTMGSSQAMRTAWVEDVLSLIPPILYLASVRVNKWPANARHPYAYRRVSTAAFMGAALALLLFALYMLYDSVMSLIHQKHPTIGMTSLFGYHFWMGWLMIAALTYSAIPPVILGHLKLKPGRQLHEKTLFADASMNKADWMTAVAAIGGIIGIGFGYWWADSAAACLIALDVLHDGLRHIKRSLHDLMDQRPTKVDRRTPTDTGQRVRDAVSALDWVQQVDVRLHDEGALVAGEVYVVPNSEVDLVDRLGEVGRLVYAVDWRMFDVVVVPVRRLPSSQPDDAAPEEWEVRSKTL